MQSVSVNSELLDSNTCASGKKILCTGTWQLWMYLRGTMTYCAIAGSWDYFLASSLQLVPAPSISDEGCILYHWVWKRLPEIPPILAYSRVFLWLYLKLFYVTQGEWLILFLCQHLAANISLLKTILSLWWTTLVDIQVPLQMRGDDHQIWAKACH